MIQLVFDAARRARRARRRRPSRSATARTRAPSGPTGATTSSRSSTARTRSSTRPPGSHANKFTEALYIGSSADAGVGCDDTRGPHDELRPAVQTIPSDPAAARSAFPWIAFEGRWGELQPAFFNGPTGPNLKAQWTQPIEWSRGLARPQLRGADRRRASARARPTSSAPASRQGSKALVLAAPQPGADAPLPRGAPRRSSSSGSSRATWTPVAPLRARAPPERGARSSRPPRACTSSGARLFLGIGAAADPARRRDHRRCSGSCSAGSACSASTRPARRAGALALLAVVIGTTLTLLGLGLVQAATACALVEIDAGRPIGPVGAYRLALRADPAAARRARDLRRASGSCSRRPAVPDPGRDLARRPLVPARAGRRARGPLGRAPRSAAARSSCAAAGSGSPRSSASAPLLALAAGPLLGALLIFVTDAPLALLNVVAGLVYALALPFVALVTAYVYFDARARVELEPVDTRDELPAEITVDPV